MNDQGTIRHLAPFELPVAGEIPLSDATAKLLSGLTVDERKEFYREHAEAASSPAQRLPGLNRHFRRAEEAMNRKNLK